MVQVLARAGLHLGATAVGRMLKEGEPLSHGESNQPAVEVTTRGSPVLEGPLSRCGRHLRVPATGLRSNL